ncbi:MAG: zf-HC2 domain-containing protein [Sciscionella sp.]
MLTWLTCLTCPWTARRLHRYLDTDPSAPLTPDEVHRLEAHLAVCVRCRAAAEEYRALRRALAGLAAQQAPDPQLVDRMRHAAARIAAEDHPECE